MRRAEWRCSGMERLDPGREVVLVYPTISSPMLLANASSRVCNALALLQPFNIGFCIICFVHPLQKLLQTVAAHPMTRTPFLAAQIPLYLYPFLNTTSDALYFEYLRLASLNVISALVKVDDTEVVNFLVTSQVATFIVQKIMLDEFGLQFICATPDRFFQVAIALATMVIALDNHPSTRVLKHVIRCYLRLTDNPRARVALQICLPQALKDGTFDNCLQDDPETMHCLQELLDNLAAPAGGAPHPGQGPAGPFVLLGMIGYLGKQEIVSLYPALSPPTLSASVSNRACNVLALLQSIASHPETRIPFLKAEITEYLYPLLNTTSDTRSFEYLRLTTLGVFGALVKVATFIIQKIIIDEAGLQYICDTPERFFGIATVLTSMVAEQPSTRLLKHIVRCYLRLTDDPRARTALRTSLPEALRDGTFHNCLEVSLALDSSAASYQPLRRLHQLEDFSRVLTVSCYCKHRMTLLQ
ncbi:Cell differentiation protein RCD1-like protein [Dichanthelium oligosanthes]|uniref:Cell differentiation protein RCD1-like protein n=1 Tax=Dichanthelium oligosanthes TaxID=888268 RepID=A0A1E5VR94_9POAL|nr:Cell differentiation protein RCD1-like protein [Dichanthelium oligosanthes]